MNVARIALLLAAFRTRCRADHQPFLFVRCAGVALARIASAREADVMVARCGEHEHGADDGQQDRFNPAIFEATRITASPTHGLTAEKCGALKVSREAQDAFALQSHLRPLRRSTTASSPTRSRRTASASICRTCIAAR